MATFATELAGELLYNNPVVFVLCIIAVVAAFKGKVNMEKSALRLTLCIALPLILTFLAFSLTRPTLPHWNAPAYVLLILLVACMISEKNPAHEGHFKLPNGIVAALCVMLFVVIVGSMEIQTGFIPIDRHTEAEKLGRDDFTLDMYGWEQLETQFAALREEKIAEGVMHEEDGIVADEWFPLANLDYYVARPLGMKVMGIGDIPHAVIYLGYDFGKGWSFGTEVEFEHGGAGLAYEKEDEEGGEWEQDYNLQGQRTTPSASGLYIQKTIMTNGKSRSRVILH